MATPTGNRHLFAASLAASIVVAASYTLVRMYSQPFLFPKPSLTFRRIDGKQNQQKRRTTTDAFKILQLSDLHFGENAWEEWGPEQDRKSALAIRSVLRAERPDLVVLSGDQITANNVDENATTYYRKILDVLIDAQPDVRWASIFGNHDDQAYETWYENGTVIYTDAKTSREDLTGVDMSYRSSYTRGGPSDVFGTSNYYLTLDLLSNAGRPEPAARIYFFDSGGGSLPQMDDASQVAWFVDQTEGPDGDLPSVAFQHIPASEDFTYQDDGSCGGYAGEGGVSPVASDAGLLEALVDAKVQFLSVGHNHGNDYCCPHEGGVSLCFGRHSGYGGYGSWDRGSRVFMLEFDNGGQFSWSSYVRMESGEIIDKYWPQGGEYFYDSE